MKKGRIIATSIASIAMCASLIAGGTYALFTSESGVNIAVTSGKVDVNATIVEESLQTYSYAWNGETQKYDSVETEVNGTFTNGGTATFDSKAKLALDLMSPGDKATFTIDVDNQSNINVKYRVCLSAEGELADALVATANIEGTPYKLTGEEEKKTLWKTALANEEIEDIEVTVEFPDGEKVNDYMEKSATLTYTLEAVQGNANVVDHEVTEEDALQKAFEEGGYVTYDGTWAGKETLVLNEKDVVLGSANLTNENLTEENIIQFYQGETLTLASGANLTVQNQPNAVAVNAVDYYGNRGGDIVLEEGSKITAKGQYVYGISMQGGLSVAMKLYLNGSNLIEVSDGATGIMLGAGATYEIYVQNYEDYKYYRAMTGTDGTAVSVTWYVGDDFAIDQDVDVVAFDTDGLLNAIKNAPAGQTTTIALASSEYAGNMDITVANLGAREMGNIVIEAAQGVEPVITGKVTLGLYAKGTQNVAKYDANITFDGITFDHTDAGENSIEVQNIGKLILTNCKVIGGGETGIKAVNGNPCLAGEIIDCEFVNAGVQGYGNYCGDNQGNKMLIKGCTFTESVVNIQGGNGVKVEDCDFSLTLTDANDNESFYAIRTQAIPMTVENCTFKIDSTMTKIGTAGTKGWGVFVNRSTADWEVSNVEITLTEKAQEQTALNIATCLSTGKINMTKVTVNGVLSSDDLTQVSDGFYQDEQGNFYISNADGLKTLNTWYKENNNSNNFSGKEVTFLCDIDASGVTWDSVWLGQDPEERPIGVVWNGNGKTISNLTINGTGLFYMNACKSTFSNLTFDNVTVNGKIGNGGIGDGWHVGVIWGQAYGEITLDNVNVINSNVTGVCNVGGLIGRNGDDQTAIIKFVDCSVRNTTVTATGEDDADKCGASAFLGMALKTNDAGIELQFAGNNVSEGNTLNSATGYQGGGIYAKADTTTIGQNPDTWATPVVENGFTNYNSAD